MTFDANSVKLKSVCEIKYGKDHKKLADGRVPAYGSGGVMRYVDKSIHNKKSVLIPRKGTLSNLFLVEPPFWTVDTLFWTDIDTQKIHPDFLYYQLCTMDLASRNVGTAVPSLTTAVLNELEIMLPSMKTQEKIVALLVALDSKIKTNNQINDNLHQQATVLFRSWFVDFSPFGGTMPDEWEISTLGQVTEMGAGGDKPKVTSQVKTDECPYPIFSNGLSDYGLYGYTNEAKIRKESVTVSARGTIGYVCLRHVPYVPIVRLVTLIPDTGRVSAKYLYLFLRQLNITGTGTSQQQLTVPDFRKTEITIPDEKTMCSFTETITPLFQQIWANEDENTKLVEIRDTLLPKLMSGEIDISDIQL